MHLIREYNYWSLRCSTAMEMGNIEKMVKLQVFTYIHDQRVVHRQFTPDTQSSV